MNLLSTICILYICIKFINKQLTYILYSYIMMMWWVFIIKKNHKKAVKLMNLFNMSLSASMLILIILIARKLFLNKLPKSTFIALWTVALIRLLVPYQLPSNLCLYNLFNPISYNNTIDSISPQMALPINVLHIPSIGNNTAINTSTLNLKSIIILVWLIGVGTASIIYLYQYRKNLRYFKEAIDYTDPYIENWKVSHKLRRTLHIKICDTITSPLTYRIVSPVILLPISFNFEDTKTLKFVLEHEYQHIKHFDQLFKYLMIIATCVHWFNPFVWLMFFISNRDIEARCDEAVLHHLGIKQKKDYATTLLNLETNRYDDKKLCVHFNMEPLEERIRLIMKNKKYGKLTLLCSFILLGVISIGLATTQKIDKTAETISLANRPLYIDHTPVTLDNSIVLYETTLENATTFNDQFTYSTDGTFVEDWVNYPSEYLWLCVAHNEDVPIPFILDMYRKTDAGLKPDISSLTNIENTNYYLENPNKPNEHFLPVSGRGLAPGQDFVINIKVDDKYNKPINADIKILVMDKETNAQLDMFS